MEAKKMIELQEKPTLFLVGTETTSLIRFREACAARKVTAGDTHALVQPDRALTELWKAAQADYPNHTVSIGGEIKLRPLLLELSKSEEVELRRALLEMNEETAKEPAPFAALKVTKKASAQGIQLSQPHNWPTPYCLDEHFEGLALPL